MIWHDEAMAIGGLAGVLFFALLVWQYRFRVTWAQMCTGAVAGGLAVYHIVWVFWGGGRTGWP